MISQTLRTCPQCLKTDTVRIILYGEPIREPDESKYVLGGCCISSDGIEPEIQCIECGWLGSKKEVKIATRLRRFITTDEDMGSIVIINTKNGK